MTKIAGLAMLVLLCLSLQPVSARTALQLDQNCTVSILNRTIQANDHGRFAMPNVPSFMGQIRARATCVNNGLTTSAETDYFTVVNNDTIDTGVFYTNEEASIPTALNFVGGTAASIFGAGNTLQLNVTASFADGTGSDVSAATSGINYTASNSQVISVDADGLVTAIVTGTSLVTARKDGVIAVLEVTVTNSGDSDGDGLPDIYELANGLDPQDPIDALEDQDRDGLSAIDEYALGTDINIADTDGDGIEDGEELIAGEDGFITNPLLADTDGDGISDGLEILTGTDPTDETSGDVSDTLTFITVSPASVTMAYNSIDGESSAQLTVTGHMLDGSEVNLTSFARGTSYSSSGISVVSFGANAGEIFAGAAGTAQITVSNGAYTFAVDVEITSFDPVAVAALDIPGYANNVDVQGDYAYVAAGDAGLQVVDISDPANPLIVGALDTAGIAIDVKVRGSYVYLADGENGLVVVDVSVPTLPALVSIADTSGVAQDLAIQRNFAYVADGAGGIEIFNIGDLSNIFSVAIESDIVGAKGVSVQDNIMAAINDSALTIYDISNKNSPLPLSSVNIGNLKNLAMDDGYIHVAAYSAGWRVYRISDTFALELVDGDASVAPRDVALIDGFAFYAEQLFPNVVAYFNIKSPDAPVFQGTINLSPFGDFAGTGIALNNTHAFITEENYVVRDDYGSTGNTKLFIAKYREQQDVNGVSPTITLSAVDSVFVEGSRVTVSADARDDVAVARVEFYVSGVKVGEDTTYPYEIDYTLPFGDVPIVVFAKAIDLGGNEASSVLGNISLLPDLDADGLADEDEINIWLTNPSEPDTDADGVNDGEEVARGINPNLADTDGDGISDSQELMDETDPTNPDIVAPILISSTPADNDIDIAENAPVHVVFDGPLLPKSIRPSSLQLLEQGQIGGDVSGTVRLVGDDSELVFTPSELLKDFTYYSVTVSGVKDTAGNPLSSPAQFSFTTGNTVDTDRPTVASINPESGGTNVPVNALVTVRLSEPVDPLSVDSNAFYIWDNQTGSKLDGFASILDDNRTLTFTPNIPYPVGRQLRITLTSQIVDFFGNTLVARTYYFTTSFDTDISGPAIVTTTVSDGQTDVPRNARLRIRFDEAVSSLSLDNIRLSQAGVDVLTDRSISSDRRVVTLTPRLQLAGNNQYLLNIDLIADLSGNLLVQDRSIGFTTDSGIDNDTGTVIRYAPYNDTHDIPLNGIVEYWVSERLDPTTLTANTVYLQSLTTGVRAASSIALSADGRRLTLTPDSLLTAGEQYRGYFGYGDGVYDLSGRRISNNASVVFTVGSEASNAAPTVTAHNLIADTSAVALNASVKLQFDQPLNSLCVFAAGAITLSDGVNEVAGTITLSNDTASNEITFDPADDLVASTNYSLAIEGLCDASGQVLSGYSLNFTTGTARDTTRPTVTSQTPVHQSVDVAVSTNITVEFSELLDPLGFTTSLEQQQIRVYDAANNNIAGDWSVSGNQVVFTPLTPLPGGTRINVRFNSSTLRDQAGNVISTYIGYFDTESVFDTTPPTVISITPSDGAMDIGRSTEVVLTFSESINSGDINSNNFLLYANGDAIYPSVSRSYDNRTVTLKRSWPAGQTIAVVVTGDVHDLSGNALVDYVSLFNTAVADSTRPRVTKQYPPNGATEVSAAEIVLYTSESMNESTLATALRVSENGILIDGSLAVSDARALVYTPALPFAEGALVQLFLDSTATDVSGNAINSYQGNFRIDAAGNTLGVRPLPTAYSPFNGQADAPLNPVIQVAYNQTLNPASVTAARVWLRKLSDSAVIASALSVVNDNRVIQLVPDAPLESGTQYRVELRIGIEDSDGDAQTINRAIAFTTAVDAVNDDQAPLVLALSPPDGSTEVPLNPQYHLRYDEAVNSISFAKTPGMGVSFAANKREVFYYRYAPLAADTDIVEIAPVITDVAGNAALAASTSFRTGSVLDTVGPSIVSTFPLSNSVMPTNTVVRVQLSELIDPASLTEDRFYVQDNDNGNIRVPGTVSLENGNRALVWVPDSVLGVGRRFRIVMNGLTDLSGNNSASLSRYFSTSFDSDLIPPQIVSTTVVEGQTDVPTNARLRVRFDEPMDRGSIADVQVTVGGVAQAVNTAFSNDGHMLTLTPKQLLPANSIVIFNIADVRDLGGNLLVQDRSIGFTTDSGIDNAVGNIEVYSPTNNLVGVPLNARVEWRSSERIDSTTLMDNEVYLLDLGSNLRVASTLNISADGRQVTLTPEAELMPNRLYRAHLSYGSYLLDLSGNRINRITSTFTTGDSRNLQAPAITLHNLDGGNSDVALNVSLRLIFDTPLNGICVNTDTVLLNDGVSNIAGSVTLNTDSREIVFDPDVDLAASTNYTLSLNGVCDLTGLEQSSYNLGFTTGAAADTTRPTIISQVPAYQAIDITVNSTITIEFSELLDPVGFATKVEQQQIRIYDAASNNIAGDWSLSGATAVFTPLVQLPGSARINIRFNSGSVQDQAGNVISGVYGRYFDTGVL